VCYTCRLVLVYQTSCDIDDHFYKTEFLKRYLFLFFHLLILEETCMWITLTCGTLPNTDESQYNFTCAADFTCTFKYSQIGNNNRICTSPDNAPITCRKSRANTEISWCTIITIILLILLTPPPYHLARNNIFRSGRREKSSRLIFTLIVSRTQR